MNYLKILTFISISLWLAVSPASGISVNEIIYNPSGNTAGRSIISYKDYEDIRIDSDLDGSIDFWHVKKGSLIVEVFFKNKSVQSYYVRKVEQKTVREFHYVLEGSSLVLKGARTRKAFQMGYSVCAGTLQTLNTRIEKFRSQIEGDITKTLVDEVLMDPSCKATMDPENYQRATSVIAKKLTENGDEDSLRSCFNSDNFKEKYKKGPDQKLALDILKAAYDLQKMQLAKQPQNFKGIITCEKSEFQSDVPGFKIASTHEGGKITLYNSIDGTTPKLKKNEFEHELLHRLGIVKDEDIHEIEALCAGKPDGNISVGTLAAADAYTQTGRASPGNVDAALKEVSTSETANISAKDTKNNAVPAVTNNKGSETKNATTVVAENNTANIPKTLTTAQISTPSDNDLSSSISSPESYTDSGKQTAFVSSANQSKGLLSNANNLVGAFSSPAVAAEKVAALPEVSGVAKPTLTAQNNRAVASSNVAASSLKRDTLSKDDVVVEQITLDQSPTKAQASAITNSGGSRLPASTTSSNNVATQTQQSGSSQVNSAEVSQGQAFNPGSGTTASLQSSSTTSSVRARQPNSTSTQSRNSGQSDTSRDEVVTFITRGEYRNTKAKLSDPTFNSQLAEKSITILDNYGNVYGAKKGEVIFLDRGNQFVRQK